MAERRLVGTDNYRVQPVQNQQMQGQQSAVDAYLKSAGEKNIQGYNTLTQGVQQLAEMTGKVTENAIARNQAISQIAVTQAQTAGQGAQRFSQELNNINQIMQGWDRNKQQKEQNKQQAARQEKEDALRERAYVDSRIDEMDNDLFRDKKYAGDEEKYYSGLAREEIKTALKAEAEAALAKQEAEFDANKAATYQELEAFRATIKPTAYAENPAYVKNKIEAILGKRNLRASDLITISSGAYSDLKGVADEQFTSRQDTALKLATAVQEGRKAKLNIVTAGIVARINTDTSGDVQPLLDELDTSIVNFIKGNPGTNSVEIVELYNGALQQASAAVGLSANAREKIKAQLGSNTQFLNEITPVLEDL